jgi:hypothetical protein
MENPPYLIFRRDFRFEKPVRTPFSKDLIEKNIFLFGDIEVHDNTLLDVGEIKA